MQGNRISQARGAKGWTQKELAARIGMSQQAIQRYEAGERDIRASVLIALSRTLDVSVSYLLGMTDDAEQASFVEVPLFGSIAAGKPIDMDAAQATYAIPSSIAERWPDAFLLRVEGESMNRILPNGCYALVDPETDVEHDGQPYAVRINDLEATVKRVRRLDNGLELLPDSVDARYKPQVFEYGQTGEIAVSIIGRVVWHCIPMDWDY